MNAEFSGQDLGGRKKYPDIIENLTHEEARQEDLWLQI